MARSADVVKRIMALKLQLSDTAEPGTVLKILQKLNKLDITIDILAETGIGKTVNSLRRHELAGEVAKSLVYGWKRLVTKDSVSPVVDRETESVPTNDKRCEQRFPDDDTSAREEVNNNSLTTRNKNQNRSDDETECEATKREPEKTDKGERKRKRKEKQSKSPEGLRDNVNNAQRDKCDSSVSKRKKNCLKEGKQKERETLFDNSQESHPRSKSDSREKRKGASESGQCRSEQESRTDPVHQVIPQKQKKESKDRNTRENKKVTKHSEAHNHKLRKASDGEHVGGSDKEPDKKKPSKEEKAKIRDGGKAAPQEPTMSFESYLNYDQTVLKVTERKVAKKSSQKNQTQAKKERTKESEVKSVKSMTSPPKPMLQESVMNLMDIPLPAALPECDLSSVDYFDTKAAKVTPDVCDASEDSAVFTCQRLNKKMQVYSGAKSSSLPAMMSLYHQCIRTLQNNINLLHETGGVPFDILEPVLERCTPEQLLRIEECNPIYIGVTDHLWGKHCQRDFKDFKLHEYESWKEMYIRLYEERERKLQRLTKSIVSAHSQKPRGRQVKMAFIHTVAKPPRDVRIQQEIHGTAAAQQPHPPRGSGKFQDNQQRPSNVEPNKSGSNSAGNNQDPRKKSRVAPIMAKSLKAFKKQLQRR